MFQRFLFPFNSKSFASLVTFQSGVFFDSFSRSLAEIWPASSNNFCFSAVVGSSKINKDSNFHFWVPFHFFWNFVTVMTSFLLYLYIISQNRYPALCVFWNIIHSFSLCLFLLPYDITSMLFCLNCAWISEVLSIFSWQSVEITGPTWEFFYQSVGILFCYWF